jgi:hypothetical protein
MILTIPIAIHIIQKVGRCSAKAGIPPLITERLNSKPFKRVVKTATATRREFNKLLGPINHNRNGKTNKSIFPEQSVKYKKVYTQEKINQSEEMAPHELRRFLCFYPNVLDDIHLLPLLSSFILTQVLLGKPLKNNLAFTKREWVWL